MSNRRYTHVPSNTDPSTYLHKGEDRQDQEQVNRRQTLGSVLRYARQHVIGADGLVELAEMLGLEAELKELAGDPERHRRIEEAQLKLGLSVDELEDRESS